jgi:hypothetical protein
MDRSLQSLPALLQREPVVNLPDKPAEFFVAGGTLWREAPSYIHRSADRELLNYCLAHEYCNVLAARQMGKSSLMVRTSNRLADAGHRTAIVDLGMLGGGIADPEAWFFGFLDELALQLGLETDVTEWWEAHTGMNAVQRFSNFLRDVVLGEISSPVTVFIDEIDSALEMAFTDDFFAAIRATYNARANNLDFQRLTVVLLGVARPTDLIKDRNRTPYNIGKPIQLSDFSLPELEPFQRVFQDTYGASGQQILADILTWSGGQPYLTQKLCAELILTPLQDYSKQNVAAVVERLFFNEEARRESNLRAIRDRIESSPQREAALNIYRQVLAGKSVPDESRSSPKNELKISGLVAVGPNNTLRVKNAIYARVFDLRWVAEQIPKSRARQVAFGAAILAVLAILIAAAALYNQSRQPALVFTQQFETSTSPDVRLSSLARLIELGDSAAATDLFYGLGSEDRLALFSEISSPENLGQELVAVIAAVYQAVPESDSDHLLLGAMRDALALTGSAGAPSLKTEIDFWLKGLEEAHSENWLTAMSFFDSALAESEQRGQPNHAVRLDRATARSQAADLEGAVSDIALLWEAAPQFRSRLVVLGNSNAELALALIQIGEPAALIRQLTPPAATPTASQTAEVLEQATATGTAGPTMMPTPTRTATLTPTATALPRSPYQDWIVFVQGEGGGRDVVLLEPGTTDTFVITSNTFSEEGPSFSPDNWKVVYASERDELGWQLYVYDVATGQETALPTFDGQAHFPVWSPRKGDNRVVFEGRSLDPKIGSNVWVVDVVSGQFEQITIGGADARPVWSPDSNHIAFGRALADNTHDGDITTSDNLDIFIIEVATRKFSNLTRTPDADDFNFAWSPDGFDIVFTSVRVDANSDGTRNLDDSRDLYMIPAAGGEERRLDLSGQSAYSPSWSPGGRYIVYLVSFGRGENEIWRYDTVTNGRLQLTVRGSFYQPAYTKPELAP